MRQNLPIGVARDSHDRVTGGPAVVTGAGPGVGREIALADIDGDAFAGDIIGSVIEVSGGGRCT